MEMYISRPTSVVNVVDIHLGDCPPRATAALRQVQKESPNKGRWFYTCYRSHCDFFLWTENAFHQQSPRAVTPRRSTKTTTTPSKKTPKQTTSPKELYPKLPPILETPTAGKSGNGKGLLTPQTSPGKRSSATAFVVDDEQLFYSSDEEGELRTGVDGNQVTITDNGSPRKVGRLSAVQKSPSKAPAFTTPTKLGNAATEVIEILDDDAGAGQAISNLVGPARRMLFPTASSLAATSQNTSFTTAFIDAPPVVGNEGLETELIDTLKRFYGITAISIEVIEIVQRHERTKLAAIQSRDVVRKKLEEAKAENEEVKKGNGELKQRVQKAERERDEMRLIADVLDEELRKMKDLGLQLGNTRIRIQTKTHENWKCGTGDEGYDF
ncbi:hypothetical protein EX30DRAFT_364275 [Ascodesmis nigricans]|uniref:GRF-type domain-containing protein n=1 Tax=Ascodesmis nigricans TaxID=341454 RepID=A0A4S2MWE2_9PEZI|nr:hypothetical protein EX30DRAFT_364275 [Ascodesmis nigricans]